ncbi:MAG TPA: ABC transporter permease [Ktedonobacterales bacterium]
MHRRAIFAIVRKDALDALINKSTLVALLTPILLAVLFATLTQLFGSKTNNLLIYNPGNSAVEQVVSGAFANVQITRAGSPEEVAAVFGADGTHKHSDYAAGLVVPSDFEASLRAGGHPQIQLFTDGDQLNTHARDLMVLALTNYSRAVASPTPPVRIGVATINPPMPSPIADLGTFYAMAALLSSLIVGTSLMPGLLIEEKDKKTIRMLMVSSASWGDIIAGKLLVGLGYQLLLAAIVLTVTKGFVGEVGFVLVFALLGSCLSLMLGLLFGSIFKTTSAAGAFSGIVSFLYVVPIFFAGSFGAAFGNNAFGQIMHLLPTYYLADGVLNAMQERSTAATTTLDIAVAAGSILALFVAAVWVLRRQASVIGEL